MLPAHATKDLREKIMGANDWIKGVIVGSIIGTIAGVLLAPKSGAENRDTLRQAKDDFLAWLQNNHGDLLQDIQEFVGGNDMTYNENKQKLQTALSAAIKAYKNEMQTDTNGSDK